MKNKNFDTCVSFFVQNGAFIGRFVRLDGVLNDILKHHDYPVNVSAALSEVTALGILCSAMLKFDGLFTLQLQGNGPVSLLVTDVTSQGKVRACAKFDDQKLKQAKTLRKTEDVTEEVPHLVGGGYMAMTIDALNGTPPYQGVVDLKGNNLSELALRYFKNSEQIDTQLKLFIKPKGKRFEAAGIMLQKVPLKGGKDIDMNAEDLGLAWEDTEAFIKSLTSDEVFDKKLSDEEILNRLFATSGLHISAKKEFVFGCRCTREKLQKTLASFEAKDLDEMCDDKGCLEAVCTFCGQKYVFERSELAGGNKYLH